LLLFDRRHKSGWSAPGLRFPPTRADFFCVPPFFSLFRRKARNNAEKGGLAMQLRRRRGILENDRIQYIPVGRIFAESEPAAPPV
jgi:hypothetical protein